jgi:transcriptional regulator with XRE-family HTH domain
MHKITDAIIAYGAAIRKERKRRNMSIEEMAEYLDVSTISLGAWERGKVVPKESTKTLIREKLGITLEVTE